MSRPLLNFVGGSESVLRDVSLGLNLSFKPRVASPQFVEEGGYALEAADASEGLLPLEHGGDDPPADHAAGAPALHAPGDVPDAAIEILDGIGTAERALKGGGQSQGLDSEDRPSRKEAAALG